jgi:hypothetical protein
MTVKLLSRAIHKTILIPPLYFTSPGTHNLVPRNLIAVPPAARLARWLPPTRHGPAVIAILSEASYLCCDEFLAWIGSKQKLDAESTVSEFFYNQRVSIVFRMNPSAANILSVGRKCNNQSEKDENETGY